MPVRVLVVDDSEVERRILNRAVSRLRHECVLAEDGQRGWDLFRDGGADVVISDWMMPGMEGDELCRRVRDAAPPYSYFIMLSGLEDRAHVLRGMTAGADDYLTKPLDSDDLEACLTAAARVTRLHQQIEQQQAELESLNAELYAQARRDPLTGTGNRLRMREDLEAVEGRVARYGHRFAALLCDIDHFKLYNDVCGHVAGDAVLRAVADALVYSSRSSDTVYRYGGEEMLVILPEQDLDAAIAAGERMRGAVEALHLPHPGIGPTAVVTVSVGVALWERWEGCHEEPLRRADQALYRAKGSGRNRVVADGREG
jgi:two-component system cell cycle response regulator